MATIKELMWKKKHIENLIWSANKKGSLYSKKDIPKFKKQLKSIKLKLK